MRLRTKVALLIVFTLLIAGVSLGGSYALWQITDTQESTNTIQSGCLTLSLNDLDEDSNSTSINLENAYPTTDVAGLQSDPYKITISNTCTLAAKYNLYLNTLTANTLIDNYIKIKVNNTSTATDWTSSLLSENTSVNLDEAILNDLNASLSSNINKSYVLASGTLQPNVSTTYEIRLWLSAEAPNETMGQTFEALVNVISYATKPTTD